MSLHQNWVLLPGPAARVWARSCCWSRTLAMRHLFLLSFPDQSFLSLASAASAAPVVVLSSASHLRS
uniref:Putative secreted peptide n=1 Tax=Anopheles braziliensis TaxID=58242 RepID=A0A2M3ZRI5_9DIPT